MLSGAAYVILGTAFAVALAWPVYQTPRAVIAGVVAVVVALALAAATRLLRWRWWMTALAAAGLYLVAVVPVAVPAGLSSPVRFLGALGDGVVGIAIGWKQLLTLSLPVGDYQAILVPLFVTLFAGAIVAAQLATSTSRRAALAVPIVAVMGLFGPVFGSSTTSDPLVIGSFVLPAPREVLLGIGLLVLSLAWVIARARMLRARSLRDARSRATTVRQGGGSTSAAARRVATAAGLVLVALIAGIAVTPAIQQVTSREALRDQVDPVLVVRSQPSPLSGYRAYFAGGSFSEELFSVSGDTDRVDRIRIATLDGYDGQQFHVGESGGEPVRFSRLPRTASGDGAEAITITIGEGYDGIWMPVPERLAGAPVFDSPRAEELADGFYVTDDGATAIDIAADGTSPGLQPGDAYEVVAAPAGDAPTLAAQTSAESLLDEEAYPQLVEWVELQGLPRTADGLLEAIERLRDRGYLSHALTSDDSAQDWIGALSSRSGYAFQSARAGHSTARIETLFADLTDQQRRAGDDARDGALVAGIGDDEQFATAAALLARHWGLDSRIVMGVRLSADDESGVPACETTCTGGNVSAWIEVRGESDAWVTVDTTPQFTSSPTVIAESEQLPENPTVPDESRSDLLDPPPATSDDTDAEAVEETDSDSIWDAILPILRIVGLVALALLLLVLPLLVLVIAKAVRRRRRRAAPVAELGVVGAWEELVDAYADHGIRVEGARTRIEFARRAERPAAVALAERVDRAVFAEAPPEDSARDESWALVDRERDELAGLTSAPGRLRAMLNPASLVRHLGATTLASGIAAMLRRKDSAR
ncbi:MAG: transglutaminase-like domain-containing protein [Microbacteriaceae bacterium]